MQLIALKLKVTHLCAFQYYHVQQNIAEYLITWERQSRHGQLETSYKERYMLQQGTLYFHKRAIE